MFNILVFNLFFISSCFTIDFDYNYNFNGNQLLECEDKTSSCSVDLKFNNLNDSYSQLLKDLITLNDDLPTECRSDTCFSKSTLNKRKGDLNWPDTAVGVRRIQKCYYPSEDERYAYYDCLYTSNNQTLWGTIDDYLCPEPPFTEEIKKIRSNNKLRPQNCIETIACLQRLYIIRATNPTHPIFNEDCQFIMKHFIQQSIDCWPMDNNLNAVFENVILKFVDMLLHPDFTQYWFNRENYFKEVFRLLKNSFINDKFGDDEGHDNDFKGSNLLLLHRIAENGYFENTIITGANKSIVFTLKWNYQESRYVDISAILFPMVYLNRYFPAVHFQPIITNGSLVEFQPSKQLKVIGSLVYFDLKPLDIKDFSRDLQNLYEQNHDTNTTYTVIFEDPNIENNINAYSGKDIYCGLLPYSKANDFEFTNWTFNCKTHWISMTSVSCECSEPGFVTILTSENIRMSQDSFMRTHILVHDLSVFLGFPYQHEVYLLGMILRTISTVALATTIFTYLVFRKTRQGVATHILINLCFSLICLLILLYIAEQRSNIKRECRIYNILRYYLILVSLMWNGIEAHNMYRMLIKVFNSHMRYFVRKAAIVAWGFPFLMVGIILIIDRKAFDGVYENCIFRCSLKPMTMHYAWLIPMSVIILHNIAVFSMVLRVLCQANSSEDRNDSKQAKSNIKSRLSGACAVLVLLGVPWTLASFGAIQSGDNKDLHYFQGIMGIIFIVFVSLQGLFIFLFHCVRNPQVRNQWRSTISSVITSGTESKMDHSRTTRSSHL